MEHGYNGRFSTIPRVLTSRKVNSLDREMYVKLTYDPNVNENMNVKRMTYLMTMYILALREWTFVVVWGIGEGVCVYGRTKDTHTCIKGIHNIRDAFSYSLTKCVIVATHFVNGHQKALQSKNSLLTNNKMGNRMCLGNKMRSYYVKR